MSLEVLFNPESVAVIGATDRPGSVGLGLCKNLLVGGDKREVHFVNPNRGEVLGKKTYPRIGEIEGGVELGVVAVPAEIVPEVGREAVEKGVEGLIVVSAGFAEIGEEKRERELVRIAEEAGVSLLGPNCLGVITPGVEFNATFAPSTPKAGGIAFVSQSGALIDAVVDASPESNYGFSTLVSYGNAAGVALPEILTFLSRDEETRVITLYLEGVKEGRRFMKAARKAAREKPVVAIKAGKTEAGKKAVRLHTSSLTTSSRVYSAVFKQAGLFEVESVESLFEAGKALAWQPGFGGKVGIVTNGGGAGILAADACLEQGLELSELSRESIKRLEDSEVMHPAFSRSNPLDIVGDASPERYRLAIETLMGQEEVGALMVIQTPQIMTKPKRNAKIVAEATKKWSEKPVVACFMGGRMGRKGVNLLEKRGVPNYSDPARAALALKSLKKK